jgi:SAM-dependent methyltransferase
MLTLARTYCANLPIAQWVTFQQAEATRLPFADATFDVAVSTQVYEYVNDLTTALAELQRVLRPRGRALILDTDWDSIVWHSTDRARMERVLAAWQEHLVHAFLPRTLSAQLRNAGLALQQQEVIVIFNPTWDVNTYSYHQIPMIASFVAGREGVTQEEAHAWAEDLRQLGEAHEYFFSLNRYLFLAIKPS